jgi:hypothetical protein
MPAGTPVALGLRVSSRHPDLRQKWGNAEELAMGVVEVSIAVAVWAITMLAIGRVIWKAGFSLWWALAPLALPVVTYATISAVHEKTATTIGALDFNTLRGSESAFLVADGACLAVLWVLFLAFAFADWPARPAAKGSKASKRSKAAAIPPTWSKAPSPEKAEWLAHSRVMPNLQGQPPGWFPSGAMGSGEQSYWDGSAWTARRAWRFESWIDIPLEERRQGDRRAGEENRQGDRRAKGQRRQGDRRAAAVDVPEMAAEVDVPG